MFKKKTPPAYGESSGPMIVAYQWYWSFSSIGPAEQLAGGSLPKSISSFWILFKAICEFDLKNINYNADENLVLNTNF
jgi:hypothetical protein